MKRDDLGVDELWHGLEKTVESWSHSLELTGREPEGHAWRVAEMSLMLANKMCLPPEDQFNLVLGALLHDIGKLQIPESILLKPGLLTPSERTLVEQHTIYGRNMLMPIEIFREASVIPYCHHERYAGGGYPRGLKGAEIPKIARVFAIVDVWDSLSTDQAYRRAWAKDQVYEHIAESSGTHFDPEVADHFLVIISDHYRVAQVVAESAQRSARAREAMLV